jgi:Ni/Co efflux regulator RcnB
MKRLILIALVMTLSSALVHAYDYEAQRRLQVRNPEQLLKEREREQEETQSNEQKKKIMEQKAVQRSRNRENLRRNQMWRGKEPGNDVFGY